MVSSGHICQFDDMQVVSVLLDEIMKDPENPTEDLVLQLDIKVRVEEILLLTSTFSLSFSSLCETLETYCRRLV